MENQDIKRGVDFENRVGQTAMHLSHAFAWWQGKRLNRRSWVFIALVFLINLLIVYPMFGKNVTVAYTSSSFLFGVGEMLQYALHIPERVFFSFLMIFSLSFFPVSFYLFVRKVVLRHEMTALLATLLFILPNPFFYNTPILVDAILKGDGAHVLVFSTLPLLLLYAQSFFAKGIPLLGFLTAISTALVAIISPFGVFNLCLFYLILMVAEGFQGNFRVKFLRLLFLLVSAGALCAFWYYPNVLSKIVVMSHVQVAVSKFFSLLPLAVPTVPVVGALSFLLFDRREKLKPIFIGLSLFLIYLAFYGASSQLQVSGIFTADRYLPELGFASAFFLSMLFVLLVELGVRSVLPRTKRAAAAFGMIAFASFVVVLVGLLAFHGIGIVHEYISMGVIVNQYGEGIGSIRRLWDMRDLASLLASLISLGTFVVLVYVVRKYPILKSKVPPSS